MTKGISFSLPYPMQACYLGAGGVNDIGVCCTVPEPLQTCDVGYSCHESTQCEGHADTIATFPVSGQADYLNVFFTA